MKRIILNFLLAILITSFNSCTSKKNNDNEAKANSIDSSTNNYQVSKTQFETSGMKLGRIELRQFNEVIKATGIIDVPPEHRADISSYYGGTVADIHLLPGQHVEKGELLFTLENPDYIQLQQDFLEAKGQLLYLKSDYERQKNLAGDNITSQKNYLKAESEYNITNAKIESLSKKLSLMDINPQSLNLNNIQSKIRIKSPFSGYIASVNINRGAFLSPAETAVTIVNTDHLHLELNVFEKDLPKIHIGQKIRFHLQEDNNTEYLAEVHLINKSVDPQKHTIGIHGHLSNETSETKFSPGMYVEASIFSESVKKASIPEDALVEIDNRYYALILDTFQGNQYSFIKKEVLVGEIKNGYASILNQDEFEEHTKFLINGVFNLIKD